MTFLEIALDCIRAGWYVFPCIPKTKKPLGGLVPGGFKDASNDEETIRRWWRAKPDANIAIACGASGLAVLDVDHGITDEMAFREWYNRNVANETRVVRTGRRPEFGIQIYFSGAVPDVGLWKRDGCEGQVKSLGGYVMAAGSIHPSGEPYTVLDDWPLFAIPDWVRALKSAERETLKVAEGRKLREGEGRRNVLTKLAGFCRSMGMSGDDIGPVLLAANPGLCEDPVPDDQVESIARGIERYPAGEPEPEVIIGQPKPEIDWSDWKARFHSYDETKECPPPSFLIDGFLVNEDVMAIAAPVAQRKTLISLNAAKSLVTGEPLFGHFPFKEKPDHVVYLCPEMGLQNFAGRIKTMGLLPYVGRRFFLCHDED